MASRAINSSHSFVDALAQLDLGGQSQDIIGTMPNEIFRAILDRVPAHRLILLRSVNKRWKVAIEDICLDKTSLVVSSYWYKSYRSELSKQLNGHFELNKDFVYFQLDCKQESDDIYLSAKLCTLLAKLFPRIEQFFVFAEFSYSTAHFVSMLGQWSSSLTTLSLYIGELSPSIGLDLCEQINQLSNLRKLNLNSFFGEIVYQLAPTLARLEHLSGWLCESTAEIVTLSGAEFTSLGLNYPGVATEEITNWRALNAQFVLSLERLSFLTIDPQVLPEICKHFTSLQMLQISLCDFKIITDTIKHLALLTRLTELRIDDIRIDLTAFDMANVRPLHNIQSLSLVDFKFVNDQNVISYSLSPNHVVQFGRFLSAIFPNVTNLTIKSETYPRIGDLLQPNLNLLANLRSFNLILHDPIVHLMD